MKPGIVIVVLLCALPAFAKPTPARRAEAKKHTAAAVEAYQAKDFDTAIREFEASYAAVPDGQVLFNLAQSYRLAHQPERALETYKKYLEEVPDAANKDVVETRMAEVQKEIDAKNAPPPPPPVAPPLAPTPSPVVTEPTPVATSPDLPKTPYEVGVYVRYLFVTSGMMAPFLAASTDMNSASVGAQFIYKYSKFDVVTSLDFSYLNLADGNYLAADHPADLDTHYTEFRNLSFLSVDVSLIGHTDLGKWLELRYGGGLGLGVVMGDVLLTNSFNGCTTQNVSNVAQCHPLGVDLTSPDKEAQLKATENGMKDTAGNPHRHPADKPPVMGVVNLLIGLRVKLPHKFSAQAEIGFRDALFVGAGANYRF